MKKINFLNSELQPKATSQFLVEKKNKLIKVLFYFFIFFLIAVFFFLLTANIVNQPFSWIDKIPIISNLKHLTESAAVKLKGEDRGRINILLLGIGGKNHEGGYLTDTIILLSIEPSTKKMAFISIPRDMAVPIENMGWRKINNINAFAEAKQIDSGGLAISQAISDIFNIHIDYYARVDFIGFEKIIDELGGINVYVDNGFDDYKYPILGNESAPWEKRYQHLHIEQGWQKMDGQLALKYARSRHAFGIEGSDFARSKRQQKILEAVKNKISSFNILFNPIKINNLINYTQNNFDTNLKLWEIFQLCDILKDIKNEQIITKGLDNSPDGLLVDAISEDGAYLLLPYKNNFSEIQYFVNNIFTNAPAIDKTKVKMEKSTVEVRNGSWINGLANKVAMDLKKYDFDIIRVGNSSQQNFQKSVIYDLTYGAKIESLTILKNKTNANVSLGMPQWLQDDLAQELVKEKHLIQPDFILVLGNNSDSAQSGAEK